MDTPIITPRHGPYYFLCPFDVRCESAALTTTERLFEHMLQHHTDNGNSRECPLCPPITHTTATEFWSHLVDYHYPLDTPKSCKKAFKQVWCPYVQCTHRQAGTWRELVDHMSDEHRTISGHWLCPQCSVGETDFEDFRIHFRALHPHLLETPQWLYTAENTGDPLEPLECAKCDRKDIADEYHLEVHNSVRHFESEDSCTHPDCQGSRTRFASRQQLEDHLSSIHYMNCGCIFDGVRCKQVCESEQDLLQHEKTHIVYRGDP